MSNEIELSKEQSDIFEEIKSNAGRNYYCIGVAGTGKSVLLRHLRMNLDRSCVVAAPTGVAALNVRGQTIHSLFRLPPKFIKTEDLSEDFKMDETLRRIKTIIIDEASMIRGDVMDAIDYRMRHAQRPDKPFGGCQMILFGDLYQLPPVVSDAGLKHYFNSRGGEYFFASLSYEKANFEVKKLKHIFRQSEPKFIELLNGVRSGKITFNQLLELNKRVVDPDSLDNTIVLCSTNALANGINMTRLQDLPGEMHPIEAYIEGNVDPGSYPTDNPLLLKEGAQVMMLRNDVNRLYVNGSFGVIEKLGNDEIKVRSNGRLLSVWRETWQKISYSYDRALGEISERSNGSFSQFPLRLAYGVTVHKAQGQTYDRVIVNLGDGAFAHGQAYVALSRCRTLDGLFLTNKLKRSDIIVDPVVRKFSGD